jgi:hypothetical protein
MTMMSRKRSRRRARPALEGLEARDLPATWGIPWPDAQHLTVSFAPDGTDDFGQLNSLYSTLDRQLGAGTWETTVLRALQTWASAADIEVGLVSDGGQPIGAAGAPEGDARFGDIRISAAPMAPGVVAIGSPYDPSTGTLSGDVILNSNADFSPTDPGSYDLYTVLLHEFGHSFGFADSSDPSSFMDNVYNGPVSGLAPGAVPALQALYGAPVPGASEIGPGNPGNQNVAVLASTPGQPGVATTASSLSSNRDYDAFTYQAAVGVSYGAGLDIRVQTAGISLLAPTVTVTDASGRTLGSSSAGPLMGGVSLHIDGITPGATYLIKVSGTPDVFGVGAFSLAASPTNAANPVVNGAHVAPTPLTANGLGSLLGSLAAGGSISPGSTSNFYSFTTPFLPLLGASVSLQTWGIGIGQPRVTIFDASMHIVAQAAASGTSGDLSFGVGGLKPLSKYYVEVDTPTGTFGIGDEVLQVSFLGPLAIVGNLIDDVVSGVVPPTPAQSSSASQPIALTPSPIAGDRVVSSLTPSIPQAFYRVTPPRAAAGTSEVMTVSVITLDDQGVTPVVNVLDSKGNPVAVQVLAAEGGAFVVQVACAPSASSYTIQVKGGAAGLATWAGAYYLDATFGTASATPQSIASGAGGPGQSAGLSLADDELFRFVLTAGADNSGTGESVTIMDAQGDVVASANVSAGQSVSLTLLLGAGDYTIYVAPTSPTWLAPPPSFVLVGLGLSDPIKAYSTGSGSTSPPTMPS